MAHAHEHESHGHGEHGHGHQGHAGHSHGARADADFGKLAMALALIVAFMCGGGGRDPRLVAGAALRRGAHAHGRHRDRALQHILTHLFAFIATAFAGGIILSTGLRRADGIASRLIAAIMLEASWWLLRDSGRLFLEAAPTGLDPIRSDRRWLHPRSRRGARRSRVASHPRLLGPVRACAREPKRRLPRHPHSLETMLHDRFEFEHATLQVDHRAAKPVRRIARPGEVRSDRDAAAAIGQPRNGVAPAVSRRRWLRQTPARGELRDCCGPGPGPRFPGNRAPALGDGGCWRARC